ncbi:MAG: hypothetical protein HN834_12700 [Rhodospirillaceae bacterium]|nr:hypothetical protein [Rhodospirillaceae bacterium]
MSPENYVAGGSSFVPGSNIPGNGSNKIVDGSPTARPTEIAQDNNFFGEDGIGFSDLLDVINPLQHLPIIGDLYRSVTADAISPGARMAGGALYGGPLGFVSSLANTIVEGATGKDIGGNVLAALSGISGEEGAVADNTGVKLAAIAPQETAKENAAPLALGASAIGAASTLLQQPATLPPPLYPVQIPTGTIPLQSQPNSQAASQTASQTGAPEQKLPQLSSAAFQAILGSVKTNPLAESSQGAIAQGTAKRDGLSAGSDLPAVKTGSIRDVGMEINRLLRNHAGQQD